MPLATLPSQVLLATLPSQVPLTIQGQTEETLEETPEAASGATSHYSRKPEPSRRVLWGEEGKGWIPGLG